MKDQPSCQEQPNEVLPIIWWYCIAFFGWNNSCLDSCFQRGTQSYLVVEIFRHERLDGRSTSQARLESWGEMRASKTQHKKRW